MLTTNFTISPEFGNAYATNFTFTDLTTSNYLIIDRVWALGDGTNIYNLPSFTHNYNYPGTYVITLTATDTAGNSNISTQTVTVDYAYRDAIRFIEIPNRYANPGMPTDTTFKVAITSAQINQPLILNLFATNSKSIPYQFAPEKWRFLIPTWRFLDKNYNVVTSLSVEPVPLYVNNTVAGVSGIAEFYFVDDQSTGQPDQNCLTLLTVTLQTSGFINPQDSNIFSYPSYANNETVRTGLVWQVNDLLPDYLKITENYLTNIYPHKWDNIKVPFLITCHSSKSSFLSGSNPSTSGILFSYPQNNTTGSLLSVNVKLSGSNNYIVNEAPLYFKATDNNNNITGGYIFTTITPTSTVPKTTILANTIAYYNLESPVNKFVYPTGYVPNSFVWVSNPERSTINKIQVEPYFNTCPTINEYKQSNLLVEGTVNTVGVPVLSSYNTINYNMSGFSGIYGMAIDPRNYDLLAADAELNRIYKFSNLGILLSTIELSAVTGYSQTQGGPTPANICIDEYYNIYAAMFNAFTILKFDKNLNYTYTLLPSGIIEDDIFNGDYLLKPPTVETDKDNNVWATYAFPLCSLLVKYSSTGTLLKQIPLNVYSSPVSLAITPENNVWVANSFNAVPSGGNLQLFTANGTLLSTVSGFAHPGYLALNRDNQLWFTYGVRNVGCVDPSGEVYTWSLDNDINNLVIIPLSSVDEPYASYTPAFEEDEEIGGLAVDVYNRLWVIDSLHNLVYTFSATPYNEPDPLQVIKIYPDSIIGYYNNIDNTYTYTLTSDYYKSAQANGDWTGNKWYQKYYRPYNLSAIPLSGTSTPFAVNSFKNSNEIYRINENFNNAEYFKSLALPDSLNKNTNLFDSFFAAAVGTSTPSAYQDLGQTVYERIANFVVNHTDVDTCNIDQVLSLANQMNIFAADYGLTLPADIKKYLDITSISKNRLWGVKSPLPLTAASIGTKLNTQTDFVTAGTKIYLQSKYDSKYTLYTVPLLSSTTIYPLSSLQGYGFVQPVLINYFFYSFSPVYSDNFIENIIDWNNPNTTLSPYISTTTDWYGDSGEIETIFNYLLTKNLTVK